MKGKHILKLAGMVLVLSISGCSQTKESDEDIMPSSVCESTYSAEGWEEPSKQSDAITGENEYCIEEYSEYKTNYPVIKVEKKEEPNNHMLELKASGAYIVPVKDEYGITKYTTVFKSFTVTQVYDEDTAAKTDKVGYTLYNVAGAFYEKAVKGRTDELTSVEIKTDYEDSVYVCVAGSHNGDVTVDSDFIEEITKNAVIGVTYYYNDATQETEYYGVNVREKSGILELYGVKKIN